jgi:hypothetical protein
MRVACHRLGIPVATRRNAIDEMRTKDGVMAVGDRSVVRGVTSTGRCRDVVA